MRGAATRWTLVLPVQRAEVGKSRLTAPKGVRHSDLARAITTDALAAVRDCNLVGHRIVVTSDDVVGPEAAAAGDHVVADAGQGLSAAVASGVAEAARVAPAGPVAVLLLDLPALGSADLAAALEASVAHAFAFVPDAEGTGTVLLTAAAPALLLPAFGGASAAQHSGLGAVRLDLDLPRLRRDVDTADGLEQAVALGVGPCTRRVLQPASTCGSASGTR